MLAVKRRAVERCRRAGLHVTLVPTVLKGVNLDGIGDMIRYMLDNLDVVKGIHFQPAAFRRRTRLRIRATARRCATTRTA